MAYLDAYDQMREEEARNVAALQKFAREAREANPAPSLQSYSPADRQRYDIFLKSITEILFSLIHQDAARAGWYEKHCSYLRQDCIVVETDMPGITAMQAILPVPLREVVALLPSEYTRFERMSGIGRPAKGIARVWSHMQPATTYLERLPAALKPDFPIEGDPENYRLHVDGCDVSHSYGYCYENLYRWDGNAFIPVKLGMVAWRE